MACSSAVRRLRAVLWASRLGPVWAVPPNSTSGAGRAMDLFQRRIRAAGSAGQRWRWSRFLVVPILNTGGLRAGIVRRVYVQDIAPNMNCPAPVHLGCGAHTRRQTAGQSAAPGYRQCRVSRVRVLVKKSCRGDVYPAKGLLPGAELLPRPSCPEDRRRRGLVLRPSGRLARARHRVRAEDRPYSPKGVQVSQASRVACGFACGVTMHGARPRYSDKAAYSSARPAGGTAEARCRPGLARLAAILLIFRRRFQRRASVHDGCFSF